MASRKEIADDLFTSLGDMRWQQRAACRGMGFDLFFAPEYEDINETEPELHRRTRVAEAKKVCDTCPVKRECNEQAIRVKEVGVWAGKDR